MAKAKYVKKRRSTALAIALISILVAAAIAVMCVFFFYNPSKPPKVEFKTAPVTQIYTGDALEFEVKIDGVAYKCVATSAENVKWYDANGTEVAAPATIEGLSFEDGEHTVTIKSGESSITHTYTYTNATVYEVNDTATLETALQATDATEDTIIININADVSTTYNTWRETVGVGNRVCWIGKETTKYVLVKGNGYGITFDNSVGSTFAEIVPVNQIDATIRFEDLTIKRELMDATHNTYLSFFNANYEFDNVYINDGVLFGVNGVEGVNNQVVKLNNCTFNISTIKGTDTAWMSDCYAIWVLDGTNVQMTNCDIQAQSNRAIKLSDTDFNFIDEATIVKGIQLVFTNVKFTTSKKAAVTITVSNGTTITANNVDISGVAADSTNIAWLSNDYKNLDNHDEIFDGIVVNGGTVIDEP